MHDHIHVEWRKQYVNAITQLAIIVRYKRKMSDLRFEDSTERVMGIALEGESRQEQCKRCG